MIRSLRNGLILLLALTLIPAATFAATPTSAQEQPVRKVLSDFVDIWNQNEMQRFGSLFTADADFVVLSGTHLAGRDEIANYHIELRHGKYGDSHLVWNPVRIRFIRPDVAVAEVATEITFSGEKRATFATVVLVQENSQWLITAIENVLVSGPPVQPPAK